MVWHEDRQREICEASDRYGFGGRIICLVWGKCLIYIPSGKGKGWCDIMTEKYFLGFQEVPFGEFQDARAKAEEKGYTVAAEREENGYPEYELKNGDVIRGDKQGGFNRMEGGEPQERWSVGTVNQYSQGEAMGTGDVAFFMPAK